MLSFSPRWSIERISSFAPDAVSAQSGRKLANPHDSDWKVLASDDYSAWAVYQTYQIKIDLIRLQKGEHIWQCSCRTYKSPCKHILAVLYMLVDDSEHVYQAPPPHWVEEWLSHESIKARKNEERKKNQQIITPEKVEQRQKQSAKRKAKIVAGLAELEQWIINIIRRGLTDPQIRSYDFWDTRASRMVDAQAPGIATWLKDMGSIPASNGNWLEPLLDQLGRLFLLIESFKRYDDLPQEMQADLRNIIGWHLKRDELIFYETKTIRDTWIVMGRYTGQVQGAGQGNNRQQGLNTQRVWLRGLQSGRDVLLLTFTFGTTLFEYGDMYPSCAIDADVTFYPSRYPLRGFIQKRHSDLIDAQPIVGETILENIENYAHALSQNPWLLQYPFVLDQVIPVQYDNQWILREVDGTYLPIAEEFEERWSLLALSGGHPIQVSGEWDGVYFHPTGAMANDRYVDFELIGKL